MDKPARFLVILYLQNSGVFSRRHLNVSDSPSECPVPPSSTLQSSNALLCGATLYHLLVPPCATSCHLGPPLATLYHLVPPCATLCHLMPPPTTLHHNTLCHLGLSPTCLVGPPPATMGTASTSFPPVFQETNLASTI